MAERPQNRHTDRTYPAVPEMKSATHQRTGNHGSPERKQKTWTKESPQQKTAKHHPQQTERPESSNPIAEQRDQAENIRQPEAEPRQGGRQQRFKGMDGNRQGDKQSQVDPSAHNLQTVFING